MGAELTNVGSAAVFHADSLMQALCMCSKHCLLPGPAHMTVHKQHICTKSPSCGRGWEEKAAWGSLALLETRGCVHPGLASSPPSSSFTAQVGQTLGTQDRPRPTSVSLMRLLKIITLVSTPHSYVSVSTGSLSQPVLTHPHSLYHLLKHLPTYQHSWSDTSVGGKTMYW